MRVHDQNIMQKVKKSVAILRQNDQAEKFRKLIVQHQKFWLITSSERALNVAKRRSLQPYSNVHDDFAIKAAQQKN